LIELEVTFIKCGYKGDGGSYLICLNNWKIASSDYYIWHYFTMICSITDKIKLNVKDVGKLEVFKNS